MAKLSGTYRRIVAVAGLGLASLTLTSCDYKKAARFGWPEGITPEAHQMRTLWVWACIAALLVGTLVWALTFYCIVRFNAKSAENRNSIFPRQTGYNVPLEIFYTVVPIFMVLGLFWPTVVVESNVERLQANPAVVVDVTAFKWNWKFGYQSIHDVGGLSYNGAIDPWEPGKANPYAGMSADQIERSREKHLKDQSENQSTGDRVNLAQLQLDKIETIGTTAEVPVLVLPTDSRIEFRLASADVVHSFFVPEFEFKRDAMAYPLANHSEYRFQVSKIDRTGAFVGRCAEMCGTYHSAMNFEIRAVTPDQFAKFIRGRERGLTTAQALESIGESGVATSTKPFPRND